VQQVNAAWSRWSTDGPDAFVTGTVEPPQQRFINYVICPPTARCATVLRRGRIKMSDDGRSILFGGARSREPRRGILFSLGIFEGQTSRLRVSLWLHRIDNSLKEWRRCSLRDNRSWSRSSRRGVLGVYLGCVREKVEASHKLGRVPFVPTNAGIIIKNSNGCVYFCESRRSIIYKCNEYDRAGDDGWATKPMTGGWIDGAGRATVKIEPEHLRPSISLSVLSRLRAEREGDRSECTPRRKIVLKYAPLVRGDYIWRSDRREYLFRGIRAQRGERVNRFRCDNIRDAGADIARNSWDIRTNLDDWLASMREKEFE